MSHSTDQAPDPRRGSGEWIQAALAGIATATIVTDAQGRVLFMSPVAERLTGWPQGEAAGQPLAAVFRIENELTRKTVTDPVAIVLATGTPVGVANHIILIARDGTEWCLDESAAPIRDGSDAVVGAVLVFRDVSDRRRAERAVEDARTFAEAIVDTVREPLLVLEVDFRVRAANRSFYRAFQASPRETKGQPLFDLGNGQWRIPRLRELLERVLTQDGLIDDFRVDHDFERLGRRVMLLNARRIDGAGSRPALVLLSIDDATDRLREAEALALSEIRYRRLFETAQDGILLVDPETRKIFDSNPFLTDLLDFRRDELVGRELWEIGLFENAEASKTAFRTLQESGYIRFEDLPLKTRDGRPIEVEFVSNVYDVGKTRVIQCNIRDITDRKQAESALLAARDTLEVRVQERTADLARSNASLTAEVERRERAEADRRELQQKLAIAQEDERRRIARELHDQMGQHLAALGLGLKAAHDRTRDDPALQEQLHSLRNLVGLIGREVHTLALELRPTALDDLGLAVALAHYCEEWSRRAKLEVDFQTTGMDGKRLPVELETVFYRVVQEALTNVLKHARASRVSVVLMRTPSLVSAVVEDNGRGFDPERVSSGPGGEGLGLLGMRERAVLVGGTLTVESASGGCTTIILRVPLAV